MSKQALVVPAVLLLFGGSAMAIEEPKYEVVKTYPDFELRRYAPELLAETEVKGGFDQVGNKAFRILADYIFGNNRKEEKISMTAPVTQEPAQGGREKIPMTAPVTQQPKDDNGSSGTFVVSFVMPAHFTSQTLPKPVDPRVHIREVPARLMAARRYSGFWTEENYRDNEKTLLEAVKKAGLEPIGPPIYARYNSPFSLWFMRRNEVLVQVKEPTGS
jgi:hypothetical protein